MFMNPPRTTGWLWTSARDSIWKDAITERDKGTVCIYTKMYYESANNNERIQNNKKKTHTKTKTKSYEYANANERPKITDKTKIKMHSIVRGSRIYEINEYAVHSRAVRMG